MLAIYVGFLFRILQSEWPYSRSLFNFSAHLAHRYAHAASGRYRRCRGVPVWQLVLSIGFLVITFLGIVYLAAKIYRVGILMYGKKPTYRELFKWLKY